MNRIQRFFKSYGITLVTLCAVTALILLLYHYDVDFKAIAIITIVVGFITKLFAGIVALVALVPFIGPLIIKLFSIPFFWIMNALGYFTSAYAIQKGHTKAVATHRLITLILLFGIIIGYALGHLVPM